MLCINLGKKFKSAGGNYGRAVTNVRVCPPEDVAGLTKLWGCPPEGIVWESEHVGSGNSLCAATWCVICTLILIIPYCLFITFVI